MSSNARLMSCTDLLCSISRRTRSSCSFAGNNVIGLSGVNGHRSPQFLDRGVHISLFATEQCLVSQTLIDPIVDIVLDGKTERFTEGTSGGRVAGASEHDGSVVECHGRFFVPIRGDEEVRVLPEEGRGRTGAASCGHMLRRR